MPTGAYVVLSYFEKATGLSSWTLIGGAVVAVAGLWGAKQLRDIRDRQRRLLAIQRAEEERRAEEQRAARIKQLEELRYWAGCMIGNPGEPHYGLIHMMSHGYRDWVELVRDGARHYGLDWMADALDAGLEDYDFHYNVGSETDDPVYVASEQRLEQLESVYLSQQGRARLLACIDADLTALKQG